MKIITVVGARPQFIKAAALSRELSNTNNINEIIIHTGQHFDENMSEIFFREMSIPKPNYKFNINNLGHGAMTGRMLEHIEEVILIEKPDFTLVYGDTNSTLAGALAARKLNVPVIHVEAGLRSFNMLMPEEINRILTDRISSILFCPTSESVKNLKKEGFDHFDCTIEMVGDVMQDVAMFYADALDSKNVKYNYALHEREPYILCTIHRQENTDNPEILKSILETLDLLPTTLNVLIPIHPRTQKKIENLDINLQRVELIEPQGYFDMIQLIRNASFIMTDSGGLQKEAFFFGKFCITLREETEWTELVLNGFNQLVGANPEKIISAVQNILNKSSKDFSIDLYGGGKAAKRITNFLNSL